MARKISGGKYKKSRKRRLFEYPRAPRYVKLGEERKRTIRERSGNLQTILISCNKANVFDKKTKKAKVAKIKAVLQIPSNRYLKDLLLKGALIETELGKAKITNSPGQEGSVQAVLI